MTTSPALAARAPLYEEVAERLRERIFARALEPGQWIDEQSLAAELGISRTPMREALKVLAAEGLVTMKPRRGAYVTEVSERDVADVYQMLALLESDAAAAAAARASEAELAELETLHAQLETSTADHARFFALNEAFHVRILAIAGNRWRAQMAAELRQLMKLSRHHSLFRKGRIEASLAEHRALLAALRRRDAAGAAALTRGHFANGLAAASPGPDSAGRRNGRKLALPAVG